MTNKIYTEKYVRWQSWSYFIKYLKRPVNRVNRFYPKPFVWFAVRRQMFLCLLVGHGVCPQIWWRVFNRWVAKQIVLEIIHHPVNKPIVFQTFLRLCRFRYVPAQVVFSSLSSKSMTESKLRDSFPVPFATVLIPPIAYVLFYCDNN